MPCRQMLLHCAVLGIVATRAAHADGFVVSKTPSAASASTPANHPRINWCGRRAFANGTDASFDVEIGADTDTCTVSFSHELDEAPSCAFQRRDGKPYGDSAGLTTAIGIMLVRVRAAVTYHVDCHPSASPSTPGT